LNANFPKKVMVIGNVAAGKTRLSRRLAQIWDLPLLHIDSVQFVPGMKIRALPEVRAAVRSIESQNTWLIDGYGPLDLIENRFKIADRIIFIDFPLWRHQWWLLKRQIQNLWSRRAELPPECDERNWEHTKKMFRVLKSAHKQMRPELLKIFARPELKDKVLIIKTPRQWRRVFDQGSF
jgi:adenylate kinase family enzyme